MCNFSAISGIISAAFFAIPAFKQERRRRQYSNFIRERKSENDEKLSAAVEKFMLRDSIRWNWFDSLCIFLGIVFLCLSFVLELFIN